MIPMCLSGKVHSKIVQLLPRTALPSPTPAPMLKVMGPNIPIFQGGQLVGFFSRGPKRYTGASLQYHGAPMRGPQWDKRMLADKGEVLAQNLANYVGGKLLK